MWMASLYQNHKSSENTPKNTNNLMKT